MLVEKLQEQTEVTDWPIKGKLWAHQSNHLNRSYSLASFQFSFDPGLGKEMPVTEPVLTPSGWREIGSLAVGDPVVGSDGSVQVVTGVYPQGVKPVWRVNFREGSYALCGEEHLWRVAHRCLDAMGGWRTMPLSKLRRYKQKAKRGSYWRIPVAAAYDPADAPMPLPPYALGALVADAGLTCSTISISAPDHKLPAVGQVVSELAEAGFSAAERYIPPRVVDTPYVRFRALVPAVKAMGLDVLSKDRFIPRAYFRGSKAQRLALLRGLMDADGTCASNGSTVFCTASRGLAEDVAHLVRSLAGLATVREYDRGEKGVDFHVGIRMMDCPFLHYHRRDRWSAPPQVRRYIKSIEKTGEAVEQVCISVSAADSLYITRGFAVTHNTATVIAEAGKKYLEGKIDTLVVVAPNRVARQWVEKQFPRWAAFPWDGYAWGPLSLKSNKDNERVDRFLHLSELKPKLRVVAFNYEAIRVTEKGKHSRGWDLLHRVLETSEKGVYFCVDESHRIKDHESAQTRGIKRCGKGVSKIRRELTGTPILQGVQDLYSQYEWLDPMIVGEENFYSFRSTYCTTRPVPGKPNAKIIVGPKNEDRLMQRIAPFTARVLDTDALDLPEHMIVPFEVEMEPPQRKAYQQMDELMLTALKTGEFDGEFVTAKIVLTQILKLQQIASGFIYDENKQAHWLSTAKVDAIVEKVRDDGASHSVVWAHFIPLQQKLIEAFGDDAIPFKSFDDVARFQNEGGVLITNPASGGTGVDGLQEVCNRAYYGSNSYMLEHRLQSLKRLHRGGQTRPVFTTDFVTEDSRDQMVIDALGAKQNVGAMTVDQLKEIFL